MAFLCHDDILEIGPTVVSDFESENIKQASYDLRLGNEYFIVGSASPNLLTDEDPYLCLAPGQFALLTTFEVVSLPVNLIGFISVKTQYKLQGLINISGFHVDPSFEGTLLFAVQNLGSNDVRIKLKEPTFTIFLAQLTGSNIGTLRQADKGSFFKDGKGIRLKDVQMFSGGSVTISKLHQDVDRLRTLITIYGGIAASALLALIINLLRK
jgi:dCTP deaminase